MNNKTSKTDSLVIAAGISAATIILLVSKVIAQEVFPNLSFDDATTIALLVFAAAPWLARSLEFIKLGDIELKFQKLEKNQERQGSELQEHAKYLAQLFNGLVGDRGRKVLIYLQDKKPLIYEFSEDTKQEYRTMLRQLRFLGFIEVSESISHIIDDKRPKVDLTQELALTPQGQSYLASPIAGVKVETSISEQNG